MILKVLLDASNKIIHRSNIRPTNTPLDKNIYLDPLTVPKIVKSKRDPSNNETVTTTLSTIADGNSLSNTPHVPIINPSDLIGRTFLIPIDKDG